MAMFWMVAEVLNVVMVEPVVKGTHARDFIVRFSHYFGII
jgi:hypothetical protein